MHLRVHPRFFVRVLNEGEVHFLAETEYQLLESRLFPLLVPLLDGTRSFEDLVEALDGIAGPDDIEWGLSYLGQRGLLDDGSTAQLPGVSGGTGAQTAAVVVSDLLDAEFDGTPPWIPVCARGALLFVGPRIHPPETPCWACVRARLDGNPRYRAFASEAGPAQACKDAVAALVAECLSAADPVLLVYEPATGKLQRHRVSRTPGCPSCGDGQSEAADHEKHVSPLTGLVASLRSLPAPKDAPYYSAEALHGFSLKLASDTVVSGSYHYSLGKGRSEAQARTGALCEALERCSGFYRGNEGVPRASWRDICDTAVHPSELLLFSEAQYRGRDEWNRLEADFNWVPEPFDEGRPVDWAAAWSLTEHRVRHLPASWCYYGYPADPAHDFCRADSNGNAAGPALLPAVLSGLMEVVERDSVAMWWYNRVDRPAIDLASFSAPDFAAFRDFLLKRERRLWVLDLTADLGMPAAAALSDGRESPSDLLMGFGAHLDPERAIRGALVELFQIYQATEDQDLPGLFPGQRRLPQWILPHEKSPARRKCDYRNLSRGDACVDVSCCVELLRERGLELIVLNQTRPEIGLPVVKAIVPGLRPFWARFAPGRLYDVPVRAGWLAEPRLERDLNPIHLKF